MDTDARLIELETRLAFQDRTIETLNEVVLQLRADLLAMDRKIDELRDHLAGAGPETGPADDRPPHW
jgi:uncharacterized coiled-coil protein SlyX